MVWIWSGSCVEGLSDHWELIRLLGYLPPKWITISVAHMMLLLGGRKKWRCSRKAPLVSGPFLSFYSLVAKGEQLLPYPDIFWLTSRPTNRSSWTSTGTLETMNQNSSFVFLYHNDKSTYHLLWLQEKVSLQCSKYREIWVEHWTAYVWFILAFCG